MMPPELMTPEARLAAAILLGGSGSRLSALSAAHWTRLTRNPPPEIHVATRHRRAEVDGMRWHRDPLLLSDQTHCRRMPITVPALIPAEVAKYLSLWDLKGVLAELEYRYDIDAASVLVRPNRPGAQKLRQAIAEHTPQLAETRSELERAFVVFLSDRRFALPAFNHPVGTSTVDAVYDDLKIAIELDGVKGHTGDRRVLRDHRRDLHRRHEGFTPLRYHFAQLTSDADLIAAELLRLGVPCAA